MRVGFHDPFTGAPGGGERYLFTMLAETAASLPEAEVVVLSPERPDAVAWRTVGVEADPEAFSWRPTRAAELTARSGDLDLLVTLAADVPVASAARRSVAVIQFPFRARERWPARARALAARAAGRERAPAALAGYDRFLAYSPFARRWIARRLGVDAEVLAPPVDPPRRPPPAQRRRSIVSVGRFFRGAHEKRQDVLIDAFRALDAQGWELHLAGAADPSPATARWVEELRERAAGLAVSLHVDAPREAVLDLYADASLYWHAAGHGVDPERHPERLEHFGIAVAEAMAHGTVPLVVPEGGPAELVEDGRTGAHWRTVAELVERTRALIAADLGPMRAAAAAEAARYDTARFRAAVRERVLDPLLAGGPSETPHG